MSMAISLDRPDMTDLSNRDFLFAGGFHLLVVLLLLLFGAWHSNPPQVPQSIEVHLISQAQLEKATHHHRPARHHVQKHHARPKPKPVRHHKSNKAMPALKHKVAPKPAPKKAPKEKEAPFDPFQPLASSSDKNTPTSTHASASKALNEDLASQLSKKEMDRYHAMIVQAIEDNWKVPVFSGKVQDPRVEMSLNPDGSVQNVEIIESSGNAALDDSLVRAIQAASPFTIPRQQYGLFRTMTFHFHPLR